MQVHQPTTTSSSTLISTLYNCIKPPSIPKCHTCNNQQPERQLQRKQGSNYFFIPDRYVDMFVCTFCKKLDDAKCAYCWDSKPCCSHREKTHVDSYFKTVKQEIIKAAQSIIETYKGYEKRSTDDISFVIGAEASTEMIQKELTVHFYNVQSQLKKHVSDQMDKNYQQVYQVYQQFEQDLKSRLNSQTSNAKTNVQQKQLQSVSLISSPKLNMSLQDCLRWLNELQNQRQLVRKMGQDVCDRYIDRMTVDYPKILFSRLTQAFRLVLLPKVTFKDAMIQTVPQHTGSLKSVGSERSLMPKRQQNAAGPCLVDQKVQSMQKVIKKDLQSITRLQQRVKQLQFILNIQQQKNQQLQLRVIQLQAQCGISHDNEISMIENIYSKKLNQNKSYDFKSSLKSSRSNPTLLNQSEIVMAEQRQLNSGKMDQSLVQGGNDIQERKYRKEEQERKEEYQGKEESSKEGKNVNMKYQKKSSESKGKALMDNSAWLEEVVNEIKE